VVERAGGHEGEKLGLEGIVSKRKDSAYRFGFGHSPDWLKMKNPEASAVKREAEEEWGKKKGGNGYSLCGSLGSIGFLTSCGSLTPSAAPSPVLAFPA
jgi:ATP-dependent DNA ligase